MTFMSQRACHTYDSKKCEFWGIASIQELGFVNTCRNHNAQAISY